MSAPDYTQRLTDRIFLLSRGCPQMCQASKCGLIHAAGRYGDTPTRCRSKPRARGSSTLVAFPGLDLSDQFALTVLRPPIADDQRKRLPIRPTPALILDIVRPC
jgi:hypothetical protein